MHLLDIVCEALDKAEASGFDMMKDPNLVAAELEQNVQELEGKQDEILPIVLDWQPGARFLKECGQ